jgi:outer membrane protein W
MNDEITGKVAYNHFLSDQFAFQLSLGIFQPKARLTTQSVGTSSLIPVLLGLKYYPFQVPESHIKPFVTTSAGLVIGSATGMGPYYARAHTESAVLFNLGLGCDFELGSLVKLTSGIDYSFSADFADPVAGSENYRGMQLFFGFGFMF